MAVSPRKLIANRRNLAKRGPLTEDGRCRLRAATLKNRPWEYASGPKSAAGKARSRQNSLKTGANSAHHRVTRAYLVVIRRVMTTISFVNAQLDRRHRESAFFCRYRGTLRDFVIAIRRLKNLPPPTSDMTVCTEWLAVHKWLGEAPVEHGDIPLSVLVEPREKLHIEGRTAAAGHIVAAMIGQQSAQAD